MPGQIKIDDGAGNYTILTNAGSLGSDKTITIPNTTGTMALTSDVPEGNPAFDVVDNWVVTADSTAPQLPIQNNLSRFSSSITTNIGTGMSVSSGIWTFPQTGIWRVTAQATTRQVNNSINAYFYIRGTSDDFSTINSILALQYHHGPTSNIQKTQTCTCYVDITDTSTHKVKFEFGGFSSGQFNLYGFPSHFGTGFTFERIADT